MDGNNPKVSVVVITYNREEVWLAAIKSSERFSLAHHLLLQSYPSIEIIIVNDGSSDKTSLILAELSEKYPDAGLKVINKPNGGPSSARNAGLDAATGDYVLFVDDDDDIPTDYIEKYMMPEYTGCDLVIGSYSTQLDDNTPVPVRFPMMRLTNRESAIEYIFGPMQGYPYSFFAYGKRFKTELIRRHCVRFDETIQLGEDRAFVLDYMRYVNDIMIVDNHRYIVKSISTASYRLSDGHKPLDYLCRNIKASYSYLIDYHKKTGIDSIKVYADNYLADKIYDYVLKPYSSVSTAMDRRLIASSFMPLLKAISTSNIRHLESRLVVRSLVAIGVRGTLATVRLRLNAADILRNIIGRRS